MSFGCGRRPRWDHSTVRLFVCSPFPFPAAQQANSPTAAIELRLFHAGDIHIDRHGSRDILALPGRLHPLQFMQ